MGRWFPEGTAKWPKPYSWWWNISGNCTLIILYYTILYFNLKLLKCFSSISCKKISDSIPDVEFPTHIPSLCLCFIIKSEIVLVSWRNGYYEIDHFWSHAQHYPQHQPVLWNATTTDDASVMMKGLHV